MMSQSDLSKMQYDGSAPTIATRQLPRSGFVLCTLCQPRHNVHNERDVWTSTFYHRTIRKKIGEALSAGYDLITASARQVTNTLRST
jgi:hypothetical protein